MEYMKIKQIIIAAALFCVFGMSGNISAVAAGSPVFRAGPAKPSFNEAGIKLRFAVISDTHITNETNNAAKKLDSALKQLDRKAGGKLNAVAVAGDMTDFGKQVQAKAFKNIVSKNLDLKKTALILSLGNHDFFNHTINKFPFSGGGLFKMVFGNELYRGASEQEIESGNYHTAVNGFHFIAVNCRYYDGGARYRESDLDWLKLQLRRAQKDGSGKPVFVVSHPMITSTTWGSGSGGYWASGDLAGILKQYPQAIYFAGHLHYPLNDEREFWQGGFTAIGTGSVFYCSLDQYHDGVKYAGMNGDIPSDGYKFSQGLYVEVDDQSNVRVTRMDFYDRQEIKLPWIIPSEGWAASCPDIYSESGKLTNKAPVFPDSTRVEVMHRQVNGKNVIILRFKQAVDDDMTFGYMISLIDRKTGREVKKIAAYSDFYRYPHVSEMPQEIQINLCSGDLSPVKVENIGRYVVKVVAFDSYNAAGNSIYSN